MSTNLEEENHEKIVEIKRNVSETSETYKYVQIMWQLFKECLMICLITIIYTVLTTDVPPKIGKSPKPQPFFKINPTISKNNKTLITDWWMGQLEDDDVTPITADLKFLMFYAPWNAHAQSARQPFETVAHDWLTDTDANEPIKFIAINCWHPIGQCRLRQKKQKFMHWPIMMASLINGRGLIYNGPITSQYMSTFLNHIQSPLILAENLDNWIGFYDVLVVADLNLLIGSNRFYQIFYHVSLRFLELDAFRTIKFIIKPNYRMEKKLTLILWNQTLIYENDWTISSIYDWLEQNVKYLIGWFTLNDMGRRSDGIGLNRNGRGHTLTNYLLNKSVLILFTPRNPMIDKNDYFLMLRQLAMEYHDCQQKNNEKIELIKKMRAANQQNYKQLIEECNKKSITNLDEIEKQNGYIDKKSTKYLIKYEQKQKCKWFKQNELYLKQTFINNQSESTETTNNHTTTNQINGLACRTNQSLEMLLLDSLLYGDIAKRFGINLESHSDRTAAIIVSNNIETHYLLQMDVNDMNLRKFIHNFTENQLERALISSYSNKQSINHQQPIRDKDDEKIWLKELNSEQFLQLLQTDKFLLIFYYSKQCGFCNGISFIILLIAKKLQFYRNLEFAKIDGDVNLLPWEYTMDSFPTILFFPNQFKSESRIYPRHLPINQTNLLAFILTNLPIYEKLHAMWIICDDVKFPTDRQICLKSINHEISEQIEHLLGDWHQNGRDDDDVDASHQRHLIRYELELLKKLQNFIWMQNSDKLQIKSIFERLK